MTIHKNFETPDDSAAREAWENMFIIEKYEEQEKRYKNITGAGETWQWYLCDYDNCNDHEYPDPATTTTENPSSSAIVTISLPLLMFAVLASILTLW